VRVRKAPAVGSDQAQQSANTGGREYQIFNPATEQVAVAFLAANDEAALARLEQYRQSHPDDALIVRTPNGVEIVDIDMPIAQGRAATSPTGQWKIIDGLNRELWRFHPAENSRAKANEIAALWARENDFDGNYQVEPAEDTAQTGTQDQQQSSQQSRFEIYRISDGRVVERSGQPLQLVADGVEDAEERARQIIMAANLGAPQLFSVRSVVQPPVAGSTADLAQQRATPGTFTGAWRVLDADGNELYRFSGIGNNQSDANRVAVQWMRDNGYDHGTDMTVVPVMS
jgi:hypothetical protein